MSLDVNEIYQAVSKAGEDWADKKAAYEALSDMTSTVRADATTDFYVTCKSKDEAKERALASKPYREHLASVAAARRAWLTAEVKYKSVQLLAELRRSEESTRREEMRMR